MKIILKDFYYKGWYVDKIKCDFPQTVDISKVPEEKIKEYIFENLNRLCKEESQ